LAAETNAAHELQLQEPQLSVWLLLRSRLLLLLLMLRAVSLSLLLLMLLVFLMSDGGAPSQSQ
jgi:hypothetical protein